MSSYGQIGDGTTTNRLLPVSIDISSTYLKNLENQFTNFLVVGAYHTCAFFVSPFTCFLIKFNDSNVCSGNGKKIKLFFKKK